MMGSTIAIQRRLCRPLASRRVAQSPLMALRSPGLISPLAWRTTIVPKGRAIAVTPVNHAQSLALLGSATDGAASGTATITYTDGTTQTFTLSFTDWAWSAPHFGNTVVVTMPYRNARYGRQSMAVHLFVTSIALQPGKTVQSVTLPTSVGGRSSLHVFAITTK